jgi:hypothetical protein
MKNIHSSLIIKHFFLIKTQQRSKNSKLFLFNIGKMSWKYPSQYITSPRYTPNKKWNHVKNPNLY